MRYPEVLTLAAPPCEVAYDRRDAMLYALSVGVGIEALDEDDLRFVYEKDLNVLPTFATNLLGKDGGLLEQAGVDLRMILHSEQRLRVHNPLPPEAKVISASRIAHVADKGKDKGAVVNTECVISDAQNGMPYATVILTIYCRGDGGFGGPSDDMFPLHRVPDRVPDKETVQRTTPNQAALYRLSIGETNPLHIDPDFARKVGFKKPLLHGLCTYGFAARAVMKAHCDNDPKAIKTFDVRFASPFYPGETMVTRSWRDGAVVSFETICAERGVTVFKNGRCELSD